ncbi:MAG: AAA family ATPase [Dysgonamonadaceae bacterium]|nr:AAA family ATPase [Dysgonamonadaceae bacterium]
MLLKYNEKVVVLIDEYDKPYIDYVDDPAEAEKVRDILANLYVQVKEAYRQIFEKTTPRPTPMPFA